MSKNKDHILDLFFNPRSIAVIGASKSPAKGGNRIFSNLVSNGYKGVMYPVNPNAEGEVFGVPFVKSVLDINEPVDLAIFYIGNKLIPDILKECMKKNIKACLIQAAGFEEVGQHGLALRDEIREITDNFTKLRIVGPNCMGLSRIDSDSDSDETGGFFSGFGVFTKYKRGNIAVITQSGMLNGGYLMDVMTNRYPNLGFRYSCSIGNKMDLCENDFLEYMLNDDTVNVIALYLESFKNPRKFIELCRRAKKIKDKTIILVKGGVTQQGQKASSSHTGSLAEDTVLIEAIFKQAHVIRAYSFHEMFQFARTFSIMYKSGRPFPKEGKISLVVGSGGAGTIISDLTMKYGLEYPEFGDEAYESLKTVFPDWMPPNRFALVDMFPTMEKAQKKAAENMILTQERGKKENEDDMEKDMRRFMSSSGNVMAVVQSAVINEPKVECLISTFPGSRRFGGMEYLEEMLKRMSELPKPVFFWLMGEGPDSFDMLNLLEKYHLLGFTREEDLAKNISILVQESKNRAKFG